MRLKDSEEKVIATEKELWEEMNAEHQSIFTVEETLPPSL